MDPGLVAVVARSLERLIAVLLGGLAIYYGFRLFLVVPVETQSDGKINLPGMSVVLAKAGPGLFFTAFGVVVLVVSLTQPVSVGGTDPDYVGATAGASQPNSGPARRPPAVRTTLPSQQEIARVQLAISVINCMNHLATTGGRRLPVQDVEIASRNAKLALLATVWSTEEWGEYEAFQNWATRQTQSSSSPVQAIFGSVSPDCPQ